MLKRKSNIGCGIFATIVVLCSGCAINADPQRVPMSQHDLNHNFQVDCSKKHQQVAMLQSMRQSLDEQFAAKMRLSLLPWHAITKPDEYDSNMDIRTANRYINFHLNQLRYCP